MDYTIPHAVEQHGDAIPVYHVVEAMARKAACGFGTRKLHGPSLVNTRKKYQSLLVKSARDGHLTVCDDSGLIGTIDHLVRVAEGASPEHDDNELAMLAMYVKLLHLNDWARKNGDVFYLVNVPANYFEYGPDRDDGTKDNRSYHGWPFDWFGPHGYFDVGQGPMHVELGRDAGNNENIIVDGAVAAIAKALLSKGSPSSAQATRDAWEYLLLGKDRSMLRIVDPQSQRSLGRESFDTGVTGKWEIPFNELVDWGRRIALFDFQKAPSADAEGTKTEVIPEIHCKKSIKVVPGKTPRVGSGKVAIEAAWSIEVETGRRATAMDTIKRMQQWADEGTKSDVLIKSDVARHSVIWRTTQKEKSYDVDACAKTLATWFKSRA